MKDFCIRTILFLIPIIAVAVGLEVYIQASDNTFSLKARYFESQATIDILLLGSSHCQAAINPKFFNAPTSNLAYGSQDLKLDLKLLENAVIKGKRPKVLVLEMSYHRFRENPVDYWRNGLYEHYYDLSLSKGISFSRYFLLSSNLKFFKNFILENMLESISNRRVMNHLNKWGYDENNFEGAFKSMNYDEHEIRSTAAKRILLSEWGEIDKDAIKRNQNYLLEIGNLCRLNNINLVLIATPVYATYRAEFKDAYENLREQTIELLQLQNPSIKWLNFEASEAFTISHFKNDDHLNPSGAELFTKMLNDSIRPDQQVRLITH